MNTDSVAVPASPDGGYATCPGTPDGKVRLLSFDEVRARAARFGSLGVRWKAEAGTLDHPTTGLVAGVNKLILGRPDDHGGWQVVRSSDVDMGGHVIDPTGTRRVTEDGRSWWAADLERAVLASAVDDDDFARPLRTGDLPGWADRLVLRCFRADSWSSLCHVREAVGDPTVAPGTHYLRAETCGSGLAPVALGRGDDPERWGDLGWCLDGEPVALYVLDYEGEIRHIGGPLGAARKIRVRTVAEHLSDWLCEHDPSMKGPARGLRQPVPVRVARIDVVGKAGEALAADESDPELASDDVQLVYGATNVETLRQEARLLGRRELARRTSLSEDSLRHFIEGGDTSDDTLTALAAAVKEGA